MKIALPRRFRIDDETGWDHHHVGWDYVIQLLRENLHSPEGVRLVSSVEDEIFAGRTIDEPWVGFLHQVPKHHLKWFPDLSRLIDMPDWKNSLELCEGLYVLSSPLKQFLRDSGCTAPVAQVPYPFAPTTSRFSLQAHLALPEPEVVFIGEYLRNYQAFFDVRTATKKKLLLVPNGVNLDHINDNGTVHQLPRLSNFDYDSLFERAIVFLNLFDAPANTTVLECIARGTPLVVNRLPGLVEYLGVDYPLFYDTLEEATALIEDAGRLSAASAHLDDIRESGSYTGKSFLSAVENSAIYRSLPVPRGESLLETFDVTVVMCSYNRVYNIESILERFVEQDFDGTFQIILWNNNYDRRDELDAIVAAFADRLSLTVIHSTFNFYCIIRLAVGSLMRSDELLICDDDVLPSPNYISHFLHKRNEYGSDAVICLRGHVFLPHSVDEENPGRIWTDYEHIRFYDESVADRQIHFFHADNCLISRQLLLRAVAIDLPVYDFWLIDDYWLSYVVAHLLGGELWKVKGDNVANFTPCADDTGIALYHNPLVQDQRTNMYVHHMRAGWPYAFESTSTSIRQDRVIAERSSAGWRGFNMFSGATQKDFADAKRLGTGLIRLGAVNNASDMRCFVDEEGSKAAFTKDSIMALVRCLDRIASCGMCAIIAPTHLPGRLFSVSDEHDFRIWTSLEHQQQLRYFWGTLAEEIAEHPAVAGFDLINEPFTPLDVRRSSVEIAADPHCSTLLALYQDCIAEIRRHHSTVPIILESTFWAHPHALPYLGVVDDTKAVYSFHMYYPRGLTNRAMNQERYEYPGLAPTGHDSERLSYLSKEVLLQYLEPIEDWRGANGLTADQILVGEFGICREVRGAAQYLTDLIDIFDGFGWGWCAYAFRDDAWDAMDYELGTSLKSMFRVEDSPLINVIAASMHGGTKK